MTARSKAPDNTATDPNGGLRPMPDMHLTNVVGCVMDGTSVTASAIPAKPKRRPDPMLNALRKLKAVFDEFDPPECDRLLTWLCDEYGTPRRPPGGEP